MKIVDLTHPISPDMPVYPGTEQPIILTGCSLEKDGFLEKTITFYSHTGTHIDAPAHLLEGRNTLDMYKINQFHGSAIRLDFSNSSGKNVEFKDLQPYQQAIEESDFLLIHTGWSNYWGADKYFSGFPVLSIEAANWLCSMELKGLGLDTISADPAETENFLVHKALLGSNIIIIENLKNLQALPDDHFDFSCFPLKLKDADGSPVRAVAYI